MNPCPNPEEQRHLKLNECFSVAHKIREAGHHEQQGIGKLSNNKRIPNGGGGGASSSPKFSNRGNSPAEDVLLCRRKVSTSLLLRRATSSPEALAQRREARQIRPWQAWPLQGNRKICQCTMEKHEAPSREAKAPRAEPHCNGHFRQTPSRKTTHERHNAQPSPR
jgi:hypothetical protein